jgi:hypothetical protein
MTEEEWLACDDWYPMMECLGGRATNRKWILFGVACCRAIWERLVDPRSRKAVEAAEGVITGVTSKSEMASAWLAALDAHQAIIRQATDKGGPRAAFDISKTAWSRYDHLGAIAGVFPFDVADASQPITAQMLELYFRFLRCVFGNPFRLASFDPAWATATVASLAQGAYEEHTLPSGELESARLAVLSDALEEAGYTDADILIHLRSPGPHVRGCWAVDLILGKS